MTVALLPPATMSCGVIDAEPLAEGPRFVRTRAMSRWHRPRSGVIYRHTGRLVYSLWCNGNVHEGRFISCDTPPAEDLVCGMCDGKAVGAGQEENGPAGRQLVFSPRDIHPPKNCPASRSSMFEELPGGRVGRCLACGDMQPLRAMGGPYNPRYAIVQHPTGQALVEPCPFHRWRQLTARDGRVLCDCGREITQ